jgi:hypothetical protein
VVAREVTLPTPFYSRDIVAQPALNCVAEPLYNRLCRQFCMLQATLVDCEGDLESIQELERCYKLPTVDGKEGSISERLGRSF